MRVPSRIEARPGPRARIRGSRRGAAADDRAGCLRIAMLAPPWIQVPAPGYGGIELVVALLAEELVARGNDVTLFAAPGSRSAATVRPLLDAPHPDEIGASRIEVDYVARAFAAIDAEAALGNPYDVVHDHCGFAALALADRIGAPVVHTVHGPFADGLAEFYAEHAGKAEVVCISESQRAAAPERLRGSRVVSNPIVVSDRPLERRREDYLLWIGRMTPGKGPHRAIAVAREAGRRLVLAGPVQPGQEEFFAERVLPHIDGRRVSYTGEVGGRRKVELLSRAAALLAPIRWPEPFGMVMVEALAAGTPVLAFPEGAAAEIVRDGDNGFLVEDERSMADAVRSLDRIDPSRARASAAERYGVGAVASGYLRAYRAAMARRAGGAAAPAPGGLARVLP